MHKVHMVRTKGSMPQEVQLKLKCPVSDKLIYVYRAPYIKPSATTYAADVKMTSTIKEAK